MRLFKGQMQSYLYVDYKMTLKAPLVVILLAQGCKKYI